MIWSLAWTDDVFSGWSINGGLPEVGRFLPRSANVFATLVDPVVGFGEHVLTFSRDSQGTVERLALGNGSVNVIAMRAR